MRLALATLALPGPTPVPTAVPTPAPGPAAPYAHRGQRPLGVTLLALLSALGGVGAVLFGVLMATAGAAFSFVIPFFGAIGAAVFFFLGMVLVFFGLLFLVVAYGLWEGHGWAWTLSLILVLLGILGAVLSLLQGDFSSLVSLLIDLFLVWYLTREGVQRWFGKQGAWPAPQVNALLDRGNAR